MNRAFKDIFESSELNRILNAELAQGNEIAEVTSWSPTCKKLVILVNRFHKQYGENLNLLYREIHDPRYWYAEYSSIEHSELLVCKH